MSRSKREMREPFEVIANAIIIQAVEDWREAVRVLNEWPGDIDARRMKDECEAFLLSDRYEQLTKLDGARLLRMLRKEAGLL